MNEQVRVSGSSFYTAMRILPSAQREAMFAIYGFCREVDDIADEPEMAPSEKRSRLADWRRKIDALYASPGGAGELPEAIRRYDLRREDFLAVIDGMEMDAAADIRAPDWNTLDLYCDRVASAVGRLSVRVFGMERDPGIALAHHLGRALQLTNILRDLDEDAAIGRLYLPKEALLAAHVETDDPLEATADPRLAEACLEVAAKALRHYEATGPIMAGATRASVRAPRLMAAAYRSMLDKMLQQGFLPPRRRPRASFSRMLAAVLFYGVL